MADLVQQFTKYERTLNAKSERKAVHRFSTEEVVASYISHKLLSLKDNMSQKLSISSTDIFPCIRETACVIFQL